MHSEGVLLRTSTGTHKVWPWQQSCHWRGQLSDSRASVTCRGRLWESIGSVLCSPLTLTHSSYWGNVDVVTPI